MKNIVVDKKKPETVKSVIESETPVVVLFHASFCSHCLAMQPAWAAAKKKLARNPGIVCAQVEYASLEAMPKRLQGISGFPTIQILNKGKLKAEYAGDRSAASIVEFAEAHAAKKPKV